jgi:hypothetical protein
MSSIPQSSSQFYRFGRFGNFAQNNGSQAQPNFLPSGQGAPGMVRPGFTNASTPPNDYFGQWMKQAANQFGGGSLGRQTFLQSPGLQGQAAAASDYNMEVDLQNKKNQEYEQYRGELKGLIGQIGQQGQQYQQDVVNIADQGAQQLTDYGKKNQREFERFQENQLAQAKKYLDEGIATADEQTLSTISAGVFGRQRQMESQIKQLESQMNAPGANQEAIQSQISMIRQQGASETQGMIGQLQDQRTQLMTSVRMQAGAQLGALGMEASSQRAQRYGQLEQLTSHAISMRTDSRLAALQHQMQVSSLQMQGFGMLADSLKTMPTSYVSLFDSVVAQNAARGMGVNPAFRNSYTVGGKQVASARGTGTPNYGQLGGNYGGGPSMNFG